jgi:hypothetical protein
VTRRRRRSKSYAHERWLTTHYFFKNQARGCIAPAGAKSVTAGEAFSLGSHAMRIRDHALPPTQNYDTSFFFLHRVLSILATLRLALQPLFDTYYTSPFSRCLAALKR